ncbi:MAG: hypothetical protein JF600_14950 [Xanthomonadales bacterium]|nr:hypothetical protein [Xanthomonadales bacterium]
MSRSSLVSCVAFLAFFIGYACCFVIKDSQYGDIIALGDRGEILFLKNLNASIENGDCDKARKMIEDRIEIHQASLGIVDGNAQTP